MGADPDILVTNHVVLREQIATFAARGLFLLELNDGGIRLLGTRFPAKYVPIWRANARIDGAKIVRVIVFGLHPRYEKIKRMLVQCLAGSGQQNACQSVDEILEKAKYLFSISPATNAQLDQALKEMA